MANLTPRNGLDIPKVESRSKALVTLYASYGGYDPLTQDLTQIIQNVVPIANVSKIELPNSRGMAERRQLDWAGILGPGYGRIVEIVPGLTHFEGVKLNNVITYQQDFLQACGFQGGLDTQYQAYPMVFLLELPSPEPQLFPVIHLLIDKGWLMQNPYEFSVEERDDLRITQTVEIRCANITPYPYVAA